MKRAILSTVVLLVFLVAGAVVLSGPALAAEPKPIVVQALFVQNARAVVFGQGTLTLKGVSPMTVFFSDRCASPGTTTQRMSSCRSGMRGKTASSRILPTRPCPCTKKAGSSLWMWWSN